MKEMAQTVYWITQIKRKRGEGKGCEKMNSKMPVANKIPGK